MRPVPFESRKTAQFAHRALWSSLRAEEQARQCAVLWFAEINRRRLYLELGYSSINQYAMKGLGFSKSRTGDFIKLAALLSISLGVLNLLPVPVLDGGHILFCLAEIIRGKPVSERTQIIGAQIGLFVVVGIAIIAVYNDLTRLL